MKDTQPETASQKWTAPECPFTVEYSPRVLDDIRLAVTDAFFSLPRGGAEIGGLLLGRQENGRVSILGWLPLDCEHAFGPSFVLSGNDHAKLAEMIAAAKKPGLQPVGWWHSHTRSEIFLSDADQQIHNTFFPEPWQVAVVVKPHTFQPTRAGFFFRESNGAIHAESSYREIVLDPLPMRPVVAAPPSAAPGNGFAAAAAAAPARVIDVPPAVEPAPEPPPAGREERPAEIAPPSFLTAETPSASRRWIGWVAAAFGVALAVAGYSTRDRWVPPLEAKFRTPPSQALALETIDHDGQLQIRWNGAAPSVRSARAGSLLLLDGSATVNVPLDAAHVQGASFTYSRKSDRVDVTLSLTQPGGKEVRVATLFAGAPPRLANPQPQAAAAPPVDESVREERDSLRKENAGLKLDLARQIERNKLLQKGFEELRKAVQQEQQRKRLEAQAPDAGK